MHNFIAFKCSLFILKYGIKEAYWPVKCFNIFFSCSSQDRNPLQIPHDAFRACTWAGFLVWCRIHWISVCSETFSSQWFHTWVTSLSIKSVIQWSCLWFWNWNLYVRGIFFLCFLIPVLWLVLSLFVQDDRVALYGPHRTPHSLVPGALSAAVTSLCQGRGHNVRHCTFNRQQEVSTLNFLC